MNANEISSFVPIRVVVHEGMAIDAAAWTDAHEYHHVMQRLQARALRGYGIIAGLEVTPTDPPGRSVIVEPGLALDRDGHFILVPRPVRLELTGTTNGTASVALRFVETPAGAADSAPPTRMAGSFQLMVGAPPLPPTDVELARLLDAGTRGVFTRASDLYAPGPGEIDTLCRRQLRPGVAETLTIGQLALADASSNAIHRAGLMHVIAELQASAPFVTQFIGDVRADQPSPSCDLLYVGGLPLGPKEGAFLGAFMRAGGFVYAEPCAVREAAAHEDGRFIATFKQLMTGLKHNLEDVAMGHALLRARHVFGAAPEGISGHAPILCRDNIVVNPNDYGCCWQGGTAGKPLARESIRSATELGVNVAWYAAARILARDHDASDAAAAAALSAAARR